MVVSSVLPKQPSLLGSPASPPAPSAAEDFDMEDDDDPMSVDAPYRSFDENVDPLEPETDEEDGWELGSSYSNESTEAFVGEDWDDVVPPSFRFSVHIPPPPTDDNPELNDQLPEPPSKLDERSTSGSGWVCGSDSEPFI